MSKSNSNLVYQPEERSYPLDIQVLVEEALLGKGVFEIPIDAGDLHGGILVLNDLNVSLQPLACLWLKRGTNNWLFGHIYLLDDFREDLRQRNAVEVMRDENDQIVPNDPGSRCMNVLRLKLLKSQYRYQSIEDWRRNIVRYVSEKNDVERQKPSRARYKPVRQQV